VENHRRVCWQSRPKVRKQASPSAPSSPSHASMASLRDCSRRTRLAAVRARAYCDNASPVHGTITPLCLQATARQPQVATASSRSTLDKVHCREPAASRSPSLKQRHLPSRRRALKHRPIRLRNVAVVGLQAGQRGTTAATRSRAPAPGSSLTYQQWGSLHQPRDGTRHLYTLLKPT
jgi:hypothetical protein